MTIANSKLTTQAGEDLWASIRKLMELQNKAPALKPAIKDEVIPLSFTQERLWLVEQLQPNTASYNIPLGFKIQGNLNSAALEASIQKVIQRHEILRTNFTTRNNQSAQVVQPVSQFKLQSQDVNDELSARAILNELTKQPFNLEQDSLIRGVLLTLTEQEHILLFVIHHIVWDGWSESILFSEIAHFYNADSDNLPKLSVQYADYAVWQREWLQGELLTVLETYWKNQLGNNLKKLQLPVDKTEPQKPTRQSKIQYLELSEELQNQLKTFSRQEGATLFPTLLAAFYVLLYHYTQQENLFVCSPTANRNRRALKEMIGYFVNLLILRCDLTPNTSFRELLAQVRQTVSSGNAHQDMPVHQLVNCFEGMDAPLSQVLFALQNTPQQCLALKDLEVTKLEGIEGTADFDLFLSLEAKTLKGTLTYNSDLFEEESIAKLLEHWQTILENITTHPEWSVAELLPLSATEKEQLRTKRISTTALPVVTDKPAKRKPKDNLELQLIQIWQQVLGINPIGVTDNFFELGGKSLVALQLLSKIEQKLEKNISLTQLIQAPTVEQLGNLLRETTAKTNWTSLVPLQLGNQDYPPLFCVAPAGITALSFAQLADCLGKEQPVYVLQAQGLDDEEQPPHTTIEDMVGHYIQEIISVQPEPPYLITGMCFGNLVAFEMARQLELQGKEVKFLGMFDPFNLASKELVSPRTLRLSYSYHKNVLSLLQGKAKLEYLQDKVDKAIRKFIYKLYRRFNFPIPFSLRGFYFQEISDVIRSKYQAQAYPNKVTLFLASDRPHYNAGSVDDLVAGWSTLASGGVEVKEYFGHHQLTLQEPCVSSLAQQLQTSLAEVTGKKPTKGYVAPRNQTESQLVAIWQQVLGKERVGVTDNFFELGGKSLIAFNLFAQIEKTFQQTLPLATLLQAPTIEQLAKIIAQETNLVSNSSLVPLKPQGSKPPFFCVHGIGGNVLNFRLLANYLGEDQPFYGLQPKGMSEKQFSLYTVEEMATHYIEEMLTIQPEPPYLIGGFSFGGIVAYEMAQQLNQRGKPVSLLVLFDRTGPNLVTDNQPTNFSDWFKTQLSNLSQLGKVSTKEQFSYLIKRIQEKITYIRLQKTRKQQTAPTPEDYLKAAGVDTEIYTQQSIYKINYFANRHYNPQPYPGNLTLFQAAIKFASTQKDPFFGWQGMAENIEIQEVPGDHSSMFEEPYVKQTAQQLQECLNLTVNS